MASSKLVSSSAPGPIAAPTPPRPRPWRLPPLSLLPSPPPPAPPPAPARSAACLAPSSSIHCALSRARQANHLRRVMRSDMASKSSTAKPLPPMPVSAEAMGPWLMVGRSSRISSSATASGRIDSSSSYSTRTDSRILCSLTRSVHADSLRSSRLSTSYGTLGTAKATHTLVRCSIACGELCTDSRDRSPKYRPSRIAIGTHTRITCAWRPFMSVLASCRWRIGDRRCPIVSSGLLRGTCVSMRGSSSSSLLVRGCRI
mmetsp:Transcript_28952/g.94297  ORF Transcript_28952/g.94297 Transcript_28952/m.94297 type:complete len:258 (+) Transcript_28952:661-1434(+)